MHRLPLLFTLGLLSAGLSAQADEDQDRQLCGNATVFAEQAFEACNRLLAANPGNFEYRAYIYNSRGVARAIMGDLGGAIEDFNRAIRDFPNLSDAYSNRGFTFGKLGDYDQAQSDFEMALSIDPRNQRARHCLNLLNPTTPPAAQELVGGWAYDSFGANMGETYHFEPDKTFIHRIWQILAGRRQLIGEEVGDYDVQGGSLTLESQDQGLRTYAWRIGPDATGAKSLFLQDAQGLEMQFYPE